MRRPARRPKARAREPERQPRRGRIGAARGPQARRNLRETDSRGGQDPSGRRVSWSAVPIVRESKQPKVRLGQTGGGSISAAVFAFVERGAILRPQHAHELRGSVLLRFSEDYQGVEVDFRGDEILVADARDADRAHDLVLEGAFHDFAALLVSPLTGGLPRPTNATGRAALGRLADGRIEFEGPLRLARGLLRLMSALPDKQTRRLPKEQVAAERAPSG